MLIATWNINSVKARTDNLVTWLREARPDVVCLQEIKCEDHTFPHAAIEDAGYSAVTNGQKTYNGVALLSRHRLEDVSRDLPGEPDDAHARYIEATVMGESGAVRIASLYLPNGNPVGTDKFSYKLRWMERLKARAASLLGREEPAVLAGDFNVIPTVADARTPEAWVNDALYQPQSRAAYFELLNMGWLDAIRHRRPDEAGPYTFWDYQAGAWQKNNGIRIDHLLLSPQAADRLEDARVDAHVRGWDRPSDHVPALVALAV
jgi:exodeoxyribonuclease-3